MGEEDLHDLALQEVIHPEDMVLVAYILGKVLAGNLVVPIEAFIPRFVSIVSLARNIFYRPI